MYMTTFQEFSDGHCTSSTHKVKTRKQLLYKKDVENKKRWGAIAEYPVQIEAGGKGLASTRQVSSVAGSLNEAISYVLASRLCVATRQN